MRTRTFILTLFAMALPWAPACAEQSLHALISAARAGETIIVQGPATFQGPLIIDKTIRLIGRDGPVLDGGGDGTSLSIRAPGVELSGWTIRNGGHDLGRSDAAVLVAASGVVVSNCVMETDGFGIYLRDASDCRIVGNGITGQASRPTAQRGNGIHLWKSSGNRIESNRITGKRDGIYLSYADTNFVSGNATAESRFGIHSMYSHRNWFFGNRLSSNSVGAVFMFARQTRIEANRVEGNSRHGLLLKQVESSVVRGNYTAGHNRGMVVQQNVQCLFEGNVIEDNDIGLYLSSGSEFNTFTRNAFIRNADQVWQPPDEVDRGSAGSNAFSSRGTGNYWSDYTGRDLQGDGRGDLPYHETDVFGYILDRYPEARLFSSSPAVWLLQMGEQILPVLNAPGVTDYHPLIARPKVTVRSMRTLAGTTLSKP